MPEPTPVQEIIIVRRRGHGDGDGHHGGVWKIAFADFMTAMMAFFLVLWIVNSTSKETRSSVARYFNPIKLADTTPARKGLNDPKDSDFDAAATAPHAETPQAKSAKTAPEHASEAGKTDPKEKPAQDAHKADAAKPADAKTSAGKPPAVGQLRPPAVTDARLFEDPYAALAEIAVKGERDEAAAETGTPFRDPFALLAPAVVPRGVQAEAKPTRTNAPNAAPEQRKAEASVPAPPELAPPTQEPAQPSPSSKPNPEPPKGPAALKAEAEKLGAEIAQALGDPLSKTAMPAIEVVPSDEGLLVSLTDRHEFGMFALGSAEPQARTIRAIETVAQALKTRPGPVIVRGHTDARPFRPGTSDNWRLSASRAQIAFYILVRGGLDDKRIDRVEGHADRHLKNPRQPDAPENRRIEILLRREGR